MIVFPPASRNGQCAWLQGLRVYLGVMAIGNLVWETLHLPLYTIWTTGTAREQAFAVVHCTLGDLLIALSALTLALVVAGDPDWPRQRFWQVAFLAVILGLAYTLFSEWLNVVRSSWAYSNRMPVIALFDLKIGLSPLLQWVVVPAAAFTITRGRTQGDNYAST
jgi:predicted benzoate:H+ symporter BenE